eukprot:COSAG02_NODE_308_length_25072_cov_20.906925_8_plen_738_part_00
MLRGGCWVLCGGLLWWRAAEMPRADSRPSGFRQLPGVGRSAYGSPVSVTPRRPGPKDLDEDDLYEWVIVFGGSVADVQAMARLPDKENPYIVLQAAFERVRGPNGERVLRTDFKISASGKEVFLRVGAYDDEGLMSEAQEVGFLKRVIQLEDEDSQDYGLSKRGRKTQHYADGWTTNCEGQTGKILGYAPFTKGLDNEHVKWFEDPTHMNTDEAEFFTRERFFNSGERQRLVKSVMNSVFWQNDMSKFGQEHKHGPEYHYLFSTSMAGGPEARRMSETEHPPGGPGERSGNQKLYLDDIYPLHCESERAWLQEKWTTVGNLFTANPLPLDPIRRYFGTTIGLYFAWLELFTTYLRAPAAFGLLIYIVQWGTGAVSLNEMGDWLIAYSVFIALWSTMFLEMWKRRENELKHDWGTAQAVRHSQDIDIYDDVRPASVQQQRELEERGGAPKLQLVAASFGTLLALCVALCLVAGIPLWIKALGAYVSSQACVDPGTLDDPPAGTAEDSEQTLEETDHSCTEIPSLATWLSYGGSFINLICIILLQPICERIVRELTEHEQHRTYTEHAGSMIVKGFALQFVIHYFVLFYIAFFKDGEFLGTPDTCTTVNEEADGAGVAPIPDCINDLGTQIFVVFVVKTVLQQIWELASPKIRQCWRQLQQGQSVEDEEGSAAEHHRELFEEQHLWDSPEYEGGTTYSNFEESATRAADACQSCIIYDDQTDQLAQLLGCSLACNRFSI